MTNFLSSGKPSIRFIIPYFGAWPFWLPFFLEGCRRNADIEWLFFTDCGIPRDAPDNLTFVEMDFNSYCTLVSSRLGIDFYPDRPYKLCDIKPALGYIHSEYLDGYDFWAFGDVDVVYGDLRAYFSAQRLATKDLFSTHARRVSGHLCLIRNTPEMRQAFMRIPHWQTRFADPVHQALDEGAFSRLFILRKNWPDALRRFAARFNAWSRRSEFVEAHSTFTLLSDGKKVIPQRWFLRDGVLTNSELGDVSLPYLHFLAWKNKGWKNKRPADLLGPPGLAESGHWEVSVDGWRSLGD